MVKISEDYILSMYAFLYGIGDTNALFDAVDSEEREHIENVLKCIDTNEEREDVVTSLS